MQSLPYADRTKGAIGEAIQPCYCTNAAIINKIFHLLSTVSNPPPFDFLKITKLLTRDNKPLPHIANIIFYGSEKRFLYLVKSVFIFYWNHTKSFELMDGLEVLKKYYSSDSEHSLYDLMKPELVALMFSTSLTNKALDKLIFDSIKNRYRYNKSTWIYVSKEDELKNTTEYSESLDQIIKLFHIIDLNDNKNFDFKGFKAFSDDALESQRIKKVLNSQRILGDK
jgi:hypothetical protein